MQQQLINIDLKVDKQNQQTSQMPELQKSSKVDHSMHEGTIKDLKESQISVSDNSTAEQKPKGVVFEIPSDVKAPKRRSKKPPIARLQKKDSRQRADQEMAAIKLEVKQQEAAERRQQRIENKVRKTRESRETLMQLQTKMNIFREHQAAIEGKADSRMMLSEHEILQMALATFTAGTRQIWKELSYSLWSMIRSKCEHS
ncbi:uncharacterized protein LOC114544511 [Dendronephthya gigantea]|uniref:uncharacterized protein LOC114544511 n=1 Tax=Dendronephthya gigantea TaxID=151771 RepID=UPI00106ADF2F|nr:uncharacterized protein LOC114544511 [Dendronephthya gigantea]